MSVCMTSTSVPSRFGELFRRNGSLPTSPELNARLEEPEATASERSTRADRGGADTRAPGQVQKATRRRYSKEEKRRILRLAERLPVRTDRSPAAARRHLLFHSARLPKAARRGKTSNQPAKTADGADCPAKRRPHAHRTTRSRRATAAAPPRSSRDRH